MSKTEAPARFIVFEGGEGAGKSTQVQRLAEALRARGEDVVTTREPGGAPGAEAIRGLLVSGDAARWTPETEALLINAARADHLARTIRPALAKGQWVICDRFADSTMAYQGYGMGLDRAWLDTLRKRVAGDTEPGLTLIFDLPVEVGLGRAVASQRYEKMGRAFHETLRAAFREIASSKDGRKRIVIDAGKDIDDVARQVLHAVTAAYGLNA
jgi:dTMP kinase